jgi:hypothetical protein
MTPTAADDVAKLQAGLPDRRCMYERQEMYGIRHEYAIKEGLVCILELRSEGKKRSARKYKDRILFRGSGQAGGDCLLFPEELDEDSSGLVRLMMYFWRMRFDGAKPI